MNKAASEPSCTAREVAGRVVAEALESRAPVRGPLEAARRSLPERDRGLLHELVLGTLRWLRFVDFVIETAAARKLDRIDADIVPTLRIAVYQLIFLDRVPAHAAVDTAVEAVKRRSHRGAAGFANAVLRKVARRRRRADWPVAVSPPLEKLAIETSYPSALVERWTRRFGRERAAAALAAGNRRAGFHLTAMEDRTAVGAELETDGVATRPAKLSPVGLEVVAGDPRRSSAFRSGRIYIQDQASQAAALIPAPRAGERILDVAAAPGGKSFALLAAEPAVRLVAADASPVRLLRLRDNQARLGRRFPVVAAFGERPAVRGDFDRVVLDLPCTGSGTFARHPELKWRISPGELMRLAGESLAMLLASADLVAPGGRLCALTCSVESEENEDVVAEFLGRRSDFERELLDDGALPAPGHEPSSVGPGLWRVLPAETHDGFTVNVLRRR